MIARKQTYEGLEKKVKELEKQCEKIYIDYRSSVVDPDVGKAHNIWKFAPHTQDVKNVLFWTCAQIHQFK